MAYAGPKSSVGHIEHGFSWVSRRRVGFALSLNLITPLLDLQTAVNIVGILLKDDNDLFDCLPTRWLYVICFACLDAMPELAGIEVGETDAWNGIFSR